MNNQTQDEDIRQMKHFLGQYAEIGEVQVFDVRAKRQTPDLSFDLYLSSGGPGSPHEGDGVWDRAYFEWLDSIWIWNRLHPERARQVLLICHSFQMACIHFGIAEVNRRRSPSYGIFPVHLTDLGIDEPAFEGLSNPFFIADFREWQAVQPNVGRLEELGASILALEKVRPHVPLERAIMAVRFSPDILGLQFHPEVNPEIMRKFLLEPSHKAELIEDFGEARYQKMLKYLADADKLELTYATIIPRFLERSITKTSRSLENAAPL